ncbi:double-stranded RNA-binding protein 1-like [Forsythia ovata]|uniref:Double-stranded RNA-binding protein 1-like n=1 Tax=Forsythia ovata TaxID=205694 RepID=A0ABD1VHX0_9LAMI
MYKSKLQEMCHKYKWALPKYTCMKDGLDHSPQFKASVVVSGINFDTITICKSSKEAYNEAAKLAFLHFTSETLDRSREYNEEPNSEKEVQSPEVHSDAVSNQHNENLGKYKKKLQIFAERKDLGLPVYHVEREGSCAPCVKATVNIGEDCFVSQGLYKTSEEAEDAAAQVALLSWSTEALQEDPLSYKNLLQELTQDEGFFLPMYTTNISGEPQNQTFLSSVGVEGEIFHGVEAKSKKVAELNAAKAAYTAFIERKLFHPGNFSSRSSGDDILKLASHMGSVTITDQKGNRRPGCSSNTSPAIKNEAQHGETQVTAHQETTTSGTHESIALPIVPVTDKLTGSQSSSATPNISILSAADSHAKRTAEMRSYLLGDRVKVYTYIPDIVLPTDTVVLPIGQDKWVMVRLEFPNKNGM